MTVLTMERPACWQHEWVCKCGKLFCRLPTKQNAGLLIFDMRDYSSVREVTFGPDDLCPACGATLGRKGPMGQVYHQVGRFHIIKHKKETYRWWKPWTWPKYRIRYEHEIRGEKG